MAPVGRARPMPAAPADLPVVLLVRLVRAVPCTPRAPSRAVLLPRVHVPASVRVLASVLGGRALAVRGPVLRGW